MSHDEKQPTEHPHLSRNNLLEDKEKVSLDEYLKVYGSRISQDSERLFLREFLFPLLGETGIKQVIPQYPFIDSSGKIRRIDFALIKDDVKIALEVNGETYHAEGIIPNNVFDDNLQRQNEILNNGWFLQRFSYSQLQDAVWRPKVMEFLYKVISKNVPEMVSEGFVKPHYLQELALHALEFYRSKGWKRGIVVLPTGTGKTFLSAFDAKKFKGRTLFLVHRLDILSQSKDAFEKVWPEAKPGLLTGEVKENIHHSEVLFASKDTLRSPAYLSLFKPEEFDYIIVDEVHHGQCSTYQAILNHFKPRFMLGMTATPDRMDRKDIFELFDYNKVFEYTLNEAIENGFLVPYTYIGLKDDIDYSKIKYDGRTYNVNDLDRYLIIEKRNKAIFKEYIEKGYGDKAIGFCCSIKHAERMAEFFKGQGIPSVAITSETDDRDQKIQDFRDNKYAIAFTVDLFNEGVDFPEVRVLMFLRPTESKTVFMQQLGRGLRLCSGKERVTVLDFIGNYQKANRIRKYLATKGTEKKNLNNGRIEKIIYEYAPKCEVYFDADVEEILDNQDRAERGASREDLIDAYYNLAEQLGRKPTQEEINNKGEFQISKYMAIFDSWVKFLRSIGEFTEASYHYPQGVHLGHMLYIVKILAEGKRKGSHIDERFVRMRGGLDDDRLGAFQRQTKYKLQGLMEMGLVSDDRSFGPNEEYELSLAPEGKQLYESLKSFVSKIDLRFNPSSDSIPSWDMKLTPQEFNLKILEFINGDKKKREFNQRLFLKMHAASQMLNYLYRVERKKEMKKASIYSGFFKAPFVQQYCDQNGIEIATDEGAKHRCPFLINILESIGMISQTRDMVTVNKFLISQTTMQLQVKESEGVIAERINRLKETLSGGKKTLADTEISMLREAFGKDFLTEKYYLTDFEILN